MCYIVARLNTGRAMALPSISIRLDPEYHDLFRTLARDIRRKPDLAQELERLVGTDAGPSELAERLEALEAQVLELTGRVAELEVDQ